MFDGQPRTGLKREFLNCCMNMFELFVVLSVMKLTWPSYGHGAEFIRLFH